MRALKGVCIYIGIVLAIICGIGIFLYGIMYFVPDFRIMGVGVIHLTEKMEEEPISFNDYSGYSSVELNVSSKKIEIQIVPNREISTIQYGVDLNEFGIAFDITEYKVIKQVEVSNGVLKVNLNVTEPNGWISSSSVFYVNVPSAIVYDVIARTENASVVLGGEDTILKMNKLTVATGNGNLELKNVGSDNTLNLETLNLSTNSGNFYFDTVKNVNVQDKLQINATNGDFRFDELNASVDVKGSGVSLKATKITTREDGFKFLSQNGYFKIGTLTTPNGAENTIITENCAVEIENIVGNTAIKTVYGNIAINNLSDKAILESTHGNVTIKKALDDISILTDFGNINVEEYVKSGKFTSRKGNIDVKNTGDYVDGVYTEIKNTDGNINVDNKINHLIIRTTGRSNVSVIYREVKSGLNLSNIFKHIVEINSQGRCNVYLPAIITTPFRFKATGNINGEITGLVPEYGGTKVQSSEDYQYYPNVDIKDDFEQDRIDSCEFSFTGNITFNSYQNI